MKTFLLLTGSGPILILTSHPSLDDEVCLAKLKHKGIDKCIAHELPLEQVKERYGGHFQTVLMDLHETDDLRVLDINGQRVFNLFRLKELGPALILEPDGATTKVFMD